MKYALITDNSVQWFHYLVCISDTGEAIEWYDLDIKIKNNYLSNLYNRGVNFDNLYLVLPGQVNHHFYGNWISEYEFQRVRKMIELFPSVQEYEKIGKL
jgi:hypothetical protein